MSDKKTSTIPSWQQASNTEHDASSDSEDLIDLARQFLADDSIRNAPREEKVQFLQEKGLSSESIEKLLGEEVKKPEDGLKTVHDTTETAKQDITQDSAQSPIQADPEPAATLSPPTSSFPEPRQEMAPIITYPEFLLKPQKPPPLITISRLVNAAYALAGVSALTYGASKYLIEPMLHTLTEARTELADKTLEDLEKLNEKLGGMVSHVPYIASSVVQKHQTQDLEDDTLSITSDPTELFHRDIATQTTPSLSRSHSPSLTNSKPPLDSTTSQSHRLAGLSYTLRTLITSTEHTTDADARLQKTISTFQSNLDTMESSYNLLTNDFYGSGSSSTYSSATNDAAKKTASSQKTNEAQKFKSEIRSLKGALLAARNFPAARPMNAGVSSGTADYSAR